MENYLRLNISSKQISSVEGDESDNLNNEMGFIINTGPNRKYDIIVGSKEEIEKRRLAFENQDRNS